jgi:ABC-type uncharacterized transport system permease subunit
MNDWPGFAYTTLGAIAGAITALFFRQWQDMSRVQIVFAVFVGFSFSFFVSPLLFRNISDKQVAGGIFYLMATGSNALIPLAVKWLGNFIPDKSAG